MILTMTSTAEATKNTVKTGLQITHQKFRAVILITCWKCWWIVLYFTYNKNIQEYLYIKCRVCSTNMCVIRVNKLDLKPTTYYILTSAMGAMVLAFVLGTYALLMRSLGPAIANSIIGLFFFIPLFLVSIGYSRYLGETWTMGLSWIIRGVLPFFRVLGILCRLILGWDQILSMC